MSELKSHNAGPSYAGRVRAVQRGDLAGRVTSEHGHTTGMNLAGPRGGVAGQGQAVVQDVAFHLDAVHQVQVGAGGTGRGATMCDRECSVAE
jgi:hypothetical protein